MPRPSEPMVSELRLLSEVLIDTSIAATADLFLAGNALLAAAVAVAYCRGIDRAAFMMQLEVMWDAFEVAGRKVDRALDS